MFSNPIMQHPHDHIMANTWRLILERNFEQQKAKIPVPPLADFELLEQVLPDYRIIGLSLADSHVQRRYS